MGKRKRNKLDKISFGFWPGLLMPLFIFALVFFINGEEQSFAEYVSSLWIFNILIKLLTLCATPNLLLFLFYIRKKYDYAARGVLMATFIYAFVVLFSKLK